MLVKYLLFIALLVLTKPLQSITSVYQLKTQVEQSEWSFLKVYMRDCGYCKEIEPVCIDLEKENKDVNFMEIVGPEQSEFSTRFKISIFPTLFLFHKHLDLPIIHHGPRDKQNLQGWIKYITGFQLPKIHELKDTPDVVYRGPRGRQYDLVKVLALRNIHTVYGWDESESTPLVTVEGTNITQFATSLQLQILRSQAKFANFSENSWYNIQVKKMYGIVLVNHQSTREFDAIMDAQAKNNPDIVFANLEPSNQNYHQLLQYMSAQPEQALFAILVARSGFFKLAKPLNAQSLKQFIVGVRKENLTPHKKSQKSDNPYVLTIDNQHLVTELPKDVLLILYDDGKPYTDKLFQVANYVIAYLRFNPNIHVFICNPLKNDLKLEVPVDPLPSVIFFRNNMKDHQVYYPYQQLSPERIIEFVQQNTTFDWVEPDEYGSGSDSEEKQKAKGQNQQNGEL